jgi:acyl dehydratase
VALRAAELELGAEHVATVVEALTRTQIVQYAGAAGDFNPIHTDEVFATEIAGNPAVMAHGMLTMGMIGRVLTDYVGVGRLTRFGGRFLRPVWPGDSLVAALTITAIEPDNEPPTVELGISSRNQTGEEVFAGYATARIER